MDLQEDEDVQQGSCEEGSPENMAVDADNKQLQEESIEKNNFDGTPVAPLATSIPPPSLVAPLSQPPPEVPIVLWVETKTDTGKSYFYHSVRTLQALKLLLAQMSLTAVNFREILTVLLPLG